MFQLRRTFLNHAKLDDFNLMRMVFPEVDPSSSFVYVWRQRILEQAVSFVIAEMTGAWNDTTSVKREPVYDRSALIRAYWTLMQQHSAWQDWFARCRILHHVRDSAHRLIRGPATGRGRSGTPS